LSKLEIPIISRFPRGRPPRKLYELGGPTTYSFKELMEIIRRETGRKRVLVPLPFRLALFKSFFLQMMPRPTVDADTLSAEGRHFKTPGVEPWIVSSRAL
jgi:uncharacterized protein YbjT (DUF2867 family)